MKTFNHHPQLYNQPLRLTREQKHNPFLVIDDFFECYHLNEVREILWRWMEEVVCSPHSISNNPMDRSNHMYFYEKMEEIIEAAWIINGNAGNYDTSIGDETTVNELQDKEILGKKKRLIEYAKENPFYVINEVFEAIGIEELCYQLLQWLNIALINGDASYSRDEARGHLMTFHNELTILIKSLFSFNDTVKETTVSRNDESNIKDFAKIENSARNAIKLKSIDFFKKFPITYVRREISEWFYAAITYGDACPVNLTKLQIYVVSECASCLTEAAWNLAKH